MLLHKYGIYLYIYIYNCVVGLNLYVLYFSINLCGVEDNVENYKTYLISCFAIMVFESYGILFFCFVTHISNSHNFMLKYAFTHILFSLHILLLAVEMPDRQAFRSQVSQIAVTDPI